MSSMGDLEKRYKSATEKITPDNYEQIRKKCKKSPVMEQLEDTSAFYKKQRSRRKHFKYGASVAAAVAVLAIGLGTGNYYYGPSATVAVDVNPSISMEVNRMERVVEVDALNQEGVKILADMNLKGTDVDVAVNALLGSMMKEGYISELSNSILLSVVDTDKDAGKKLQQKLMASAETVFRQEGFDGAILSQNIAGYSEECAGLMREYSISPGKAVLAYQIAAQSTRMEPGDIANLSINDINLLASAQGLYLQGVTAVGTASSKNYIGEDKAKELVYSYSNIKEDEVHHQLVLMDYKEGFVTYEVEFYKDENKYEYEIDAVTGELLESEIEWKRQDFLEMEIKELERELEISGIGKDMALKIAQEHAQVDDGDVVFVEVTPEYENDRECYDVDIHTTEHTYEYKIDAQTGDIVKYVHNMDAYTEQD